MAENGDEENVNDIDKPQLMAHFQEITGIEDEDIITQHLSSHHWNLEAAVQDALNEKEGIEPIYGNDPSPPPSPPQQAPPSPMFRRRIVGGDIRDFSNGGRRMEVMRRSEGWLEWALNLAFLPLQFVLSTANEVLQLLMNLSFGSEPPPSQTSHEDARQFVASFEKQFGPEHPPFLIKSYDESLSLARHDLMFLLIYIHSPQHQDSSTFCREVICSQEFSQFLATSSVLCFGVSVKSAEGVRVSYILRETSYPFLALIVLKQSKMVVCERIEGTLPLEEVMRHLRRAVANNEGELVVERTERFRRQQDQELRESQDQAFEESLAADREKERVKQESLRKKEELVREEELQQKQEEAEKESFEKEKLLRTGRLPPEPEPSDPTSMQVVLRLPSGHRLERWFKHTDKLQLLYDFAYADTSGQLPMQFTLVTNFPRKELVVHEDGGPVLEDLKLGKRCALFVQDDTA